MSFQCFVCSSSNVTVQAMPFACQHLLLSAGDLYKKMCYGFSQSSECMSMCIRIDSLMFGMHLQPHRNP